MCQNVDTLLTQHFGAFLWKRKSKILCLSPGKWGSGLCRGPWVWTVHERRQFLPIDSLQFGGQIIYRQPKSCHTVTCGGICVGTRLSFGSAGSQALKDYQAGNLASFASNLLLMYVGRLDCDVTNTARQYSTQRVVRCVNVSALPVSYNSGRTVSLCVRQQTTVLILALLSTLAVGSGKFPRIVIKPIERPDISSSKSWKTTWCTLMWSQL